MIAIRTPVSWVGNKTIILPEIYASFPLQYERYIEPFGGSGAVLLGKPPDKFEVYNDRNQNLVNLFRCMKERPMALIQELGFLTLNSRDDFRILKTFFKKESFEDKFLRQELELTKIMLPDIQADEIIELYRKNMEDYDIRKAALFLKLLRYSYSSTGKSYGCQPFSFLNLFTLIENVGKRLTNTVIENQDFEILIRHYDRIGAFFYCDPPYFTTEKMYQCRFTPDDHLRLFRVLSSIKGKVLLSYNDCPEVKEIYKDFYFYSFKRIHSMAQKYEAGKEFGEILIANYDLTERKQLKPVQLSLSGF